jgi:hypothetical protein
MGQFSDVGSAEIYQKGAFFKPGSYTVEIKKCLVKDARKGKMFIVECKILASNNAEEKPGDSRTWLQKMTNPDVARPALKAFALAAVGVDPQDAAKVKAVPSNEVEDVLDAACDATKQALKGRTLKLEVAMVKTKDGRDFSLHTFSPAT